MCRNNQWQFFNIFFIRKGTRYIKHSVKNRLKKNGFHKDYFRFELEFDWDVSNDISIAIPVSRRPLYRLWNMAVCLWFTAIRSEKWPLHCTYLGLARTKEYLLFKSNQELMVSFCRVFYLLVCCLYFYYTICSWLCWCQWLFRMEGSFIIYGDAMCLLPTFVVKILKPFLFRRF